MGLGKIVTTTMASLVAMTLLSCDQKRQVLPGCRTQDDCLGSRECIEERCEYPARQPPEFLKDEDGDGFEATLWGGDDCDDAKPTTNPRAVDLCNGIDDNCNGLVDEFGCGRYLFNENVSFGGEQSTTRLLHEINLQTGEKKQLNPMRSEEHFYIDAVHVSPDKTKLTYVANYVLHIWDLQREEREILLNPDMGYPFLTFGAGWLDNERLVASLTCYGCNSTEEDPVVNKLFVIHLDGQYRMLRRNAAGDETYLLGAGYGWAIGQSQFSTEDNRRIFAYHVDSETTIDLEDRYNPIPSLIEPNVFFFEKGTSDEEQHQLVKRNLETDEEIVLTTLTAYNYYNELGGTYIHSSGKERLYFWSFTGDPNLSGFVHTIFSDGTLDITNRSIRPDGISLPQLFYAPFNHIP